MTSEPDLGALLLQRLLSFSVSPVWPSFEVAVTLGRGGATFLAQVSSRIDIGSKCCVCYSVGDNHCVMAPSGGPQGHSSLHDCTGKGHIGWKRGEVVPSTKQSCCVQYTAFNIPRFGYFSE